MLEDERALVDAKRGVTRLGFALLLKFFTRHGRFPTGGSELPGEVVEFVARQLQVAPKDLRSYEWIGRSIERHRAQIREQAAEDAHDRPRPSGAQPGLHRVPAISHRCASGRAGRQHVGRPPRALSMGVVAKIRCTGAPISPIER